MKKLRVEITDEFHELASEKKWRDAVHNHPLSVKGLTVFTQQVKRVRIQSRIKDETDRALEADKQSQSGDRSSSRRGLTRERRDPGREERPAKGNDGKS